MANSIELYRGNSKTIEVTVVDSDGEAYILTGYTCEFRVKSSPLTSTTLISKTADVGDISNNVITFNLLAVDTTSIDPGKYVYEVRVSLGGLIETVLTGAFVLNHSLFVS